MLEQALAVYEPLQQSQPPPQPQLQLQPQLQPQLLPQPQQQDQYQPQQQPLGQPQLLQLPASLARELPPFRRAALAHAVALATSGAWPSSSPFMQPAEFSAFSSVEMRDPQLPPWDAGTGAMFRAMAQLAPGAVEDEEAYRRSLSAMFTDAPGQAAGVLVNGVVLKGGHLPCLAAAMSPREAQILYVVHPWMGEPVAYV